MEWIFASAIPLVVAIATLIGMFRSMDAEARRSGEPGMARAKRGVAIVFVAILGSVPVAIGAAVLLGGDNTSLVAALVLGFFVGLMVPLALLLAVYSTQVMRHEGEEPVVLSAQSRRELRGPMLYAILGSFVASTLIIWLAARPLWSYDPADVVWVAFALMIVLLWPPFRKLKACAARDRAARRIKSEYAPAPPA